MNVSLSRSAWTGILRLTHDRHLALVIASRFAIADSFAGPPKCTISCNVPHRLVTVAMDAYRAWASGNRAIGVS